MVLKLALGYDFRPDNQGDVDAVCEELGLDCFTFDAATYVKTVEASEEVTKPTVIKSRLRTLIERVLR